MRMQDGYNKNGAISDIRQVGKEKMGKDTFVNDCRTPNIAWYLNDKLYRTGWSRKQIRGGPH